MNFEYVPELAQHFIAASTMLFAHIPDMMALSPPQGVQNAYTAVCCDGAMSMGEKLFQGVKFGTATATLAVSIAAESPAGITASVIAQGEVLLDLSKIGEKYNADNAPKI
jgi:hypothetical protein